MIWIPQQLGLTRDCSQTGKTHFKLAILVGDGVSVGGREGGAAGLARGAPALAFYPRGVVRVDLVANGPW